MLVIALLVTLVFTLASLSVSQLTMVSSLSSREEAENAAQAVISLAVERLQKDVAFGSSASNNTLNVTVNGAEGWLTFDQATAADRGLPWSSNNLAGVGSRKGWGGGTVAAGSVRLLAVGTARGARERLEAVVRVPALPTLAAGGPVNASGGVTIASVASLEQIGPLLRREPGTESLPADLLSNSNADPAITLGAGTRVAGDVQAVGNIQLASAEDCLVEGEVRGGALPVSLPQVNLQALDPAGPGCVDLPPSMTSQTLSGRARSSGSLLVNGDLELDAALLFIAGDLRVRGGVKGKGALVVLGATTIENGCALDAGHRLALLSRGDVTLTGGGAQGSFFQGLVYTEGRLTANQLTVVGSVLAQGNGPVGLTDSNVVTLGETQDYLLGPDEVQMTVTAPIPQSLGYRQLRVRVTGNPDLMTYELVGEYSTGGNSGDGGGGNGDLAPADDTSVANFWAMACQAWGIPTGSRSYTSQSGGMIVIDVANMQQHGCRTVDGQLLANTLRDAMVRAQAEPTFEYRPSRLWRWEDRVRVCLWRKLN